MAGNRSAWRGLVLVGLLGCGTPVVAVVETVDDTGTAVRLQSPAQRVVSLAPHTTELLYAVGAGPQLVGAAFSDHPPEAAALPALGGAGGLDLEAIVAARPDLVIAWGSGNPAGTVDALRRLGLPVFVSEPGGLDDIASGLERLGRLTGHPEAGALAASRFRLRLEGLRRDHAGRSPVTVFYQLWDAPPMTVGGRHIISQVMEICGGRNLFGDLGPLAAAVETEAVLARDPEVIVASGSGPERPAWLDLWRRWPKLTAVRAGNLFAIDPDLLQRHTPRLLDGTERLCRHLDEARGRLTKP